MINFEYEDVCNYLIACRDGDWDIPINWNYPPHMINDILKYKYVNYKIDNIYLYLSHPKYSKVIFHTYGIRLPDFFTYLRTVKINNFLKHIEHDKL